MLTWPAAEFMKPWAMCPGLEPIWRWRFIAIQLWRMKVLAALGYPATNESNRQHAASAVGPERWKCDAGVFQAMIS